MKKKFSQLFLGALLLITLPAQAVLLYGVQAANPNLVTVDTMTGLIINVGPLPAGSDPVTDPVQGLTGIAGGNLLYTDGNALGGVHELNPSNAALITTYGLPVVADRGGLSFDTPSNMLFSVYNGFTISSQAGLGGAVDTNFITSPFPDFPGAIGGDDNGRHFSQGVISDWAGIYEFDVTGAILNTLAYPVIDALPSGLAFDGQFLYASDMLSNLLFTLNPSDGSILSQVSYEGPPLTALAALPAPAPATLALMGLGLAGIGFARKK